LNWVSEALTLRFFSGTVIGGSLRFWVWVRMVEGEECAEETQKALKEILGLSLGESLFIKWNWDWWKCGVNCRDSMKEQRYTERMVERVREGRKGSKTKSN